MRKKILLAVMIVATPLGWPIAVSPLMAQAQQADATSAANRLPFCHGRKPRLAGGFRGGPKTRHRIFPAKSRPPRRPNVLVILTDDVGFSATSPFGGPIPTETFDRLAKNGLRYTQFHTTALCSPTRAAPVRPQPPFGCVGRHHGTGNWFSGLQHIDAEELRDVCRSLEAEWLQHGLVRQESQRAGLAFQSGRAVRPLAHRSGFRILLRIHRRGYQSVGTGPLREHEADRAASRCEGLFLRKGHGGPMH